MFGPSHSRYVPYPWRQSSRFRARIAKGRPAFRDRITKDIIRVQNRTSKGRCGLRKWWWLVSEKIIGVPSSAVSLGKGERYNTVNQGTVNRNFTVLQFAKWIFCLFALIFQQVNNILPSDKTLDLSSPSVLRLHVLPQYFSMNIMYFSDLQKPWDKPNWHAPSSSTSSRLVFSLLVKPEWETTWVR